MLPSVSVQQLEWVNLALIIAHSLVVIKSQDGHYVNVFSLYIECTFDVCILYFGYELISVSVMFL